LNVLDEVLTQTEMQVWTR